MTGLAHFLLQLAENIAETAAATLGLSAADLLTQLLLQLSQNIAKATALTAAALQHFA